MSFRRSGAALDSEWVCYRDESGRKYGGKSLFVKPWRPGDGLRCSHASKGHRFECGPPVASIKSVNHRARYVGPASNPQWEDKHISSVVCADHLAAQFSGSSVGELNAEAEESARQQVIAAHWDEYLTALEERRAELRQGSLDSLPDEIADAIRRAEDAA